jgi:hypothetical protein
VVDPSSAPEPPAGPRRLYGCVTGCYRPNGSATSARPYDSCPCPCCRRAPHRGTTVWSPLGARAYGAQSRLRASSSPRWQKRAVEAYMCGELRPSGHGADRRPQSGPAQPRTSTALARSGLDMCGLCHVLLLGLLAVESKSTWVLKADKWATSAQADGGSSAPRHGLNSQGPPPASVEQPSTQRIGPRRPGCRSATLPRRHFRQAVARGPSPFDQRHGAPPRTFSACCCRASRSRLV